MLIKVNIDGNINVNVWNDQPNVNWSMQASLGFSNIYDSNLISGISKCKYNYANAPFIIKK